MRLWSIHPKYLDSIGLVALWREGLLAKKVLMGKTKGYKNHPQLKRFKEYSSPVKAINTYLYYVFLESQKRGYNFNETKCKNFNLKKEIKITTGQIEYEFTHLAKKLKIRDNKKFIEIKKTTKIELNPLFKKINGKISDWEKV